MCFPSFRIWVQGSKRKPGNHGKSLFYSIFLKLYQICFCVSLSLFLLPEFVIPLFKCYFRDFRGFCDFRVFGLALYQSQQLIPTLYILVYILFIYLFYTYFILGYYTSLLYYTLIKNIYDSTSYFILALFPSYCLHDSEIFKISPMLVFLEPNRSKFYRV